MNMFYGVLGVVAIMGIGGTKGWHLKSIEYWFIAIPASFVWMGIAMKIWS